MQNDNRLLAVVATWLFVLGLLIGGALYELQGQEAPFPGALWGWNVDMLDGLDHPATCFVDHPGFAGTTPGTLQWCIEQPGDQLILCRLGAAQNAIEPSGYRQIRTRGTTGMKIVAGISCPQGNLTIRTLTDAGTAGGDTSIWLEGNNDGFILADVYGWDNKCVQEPNMVCTNEEQNQLRMYQSNIAILRSAFHMNSGDEIVSITESRGVQIENLLMYQTAIGPVSKVASDPGGNTGEGQCAPVSFGTSKVAMIQVVGLTCGHRFFVLRGDEIYAKDVSVGGWGSRNMETGQGNPHGDQTRAIIDGMTYMGNMPTVENQITFMLRPLRTQGQLDRFKAGGIQIFVNDVKGSDQLGQPYQQTWNGTVEWLARASCESASVDITACQDRQGVTFSDIEIDDWFTLTPPFVAPPAPDIGDGYVHNVVNENIGPRFRYTCLGVLEEVGVGPLLGKMLAHARDGTGAPLNRFPTTAEFWHEPWPDNAQTGENCPDQDNDGLPDDAERRWNLVFGREANPRSIGITNDEDGDGVELWKEYFVHLTDPTVDDRQLTPPPDTIPPPNPEPGDTCELRLVDANGVTLAVFVVTEPCDEGGVIG